MFLMWVLVFVSMSSYKFECSNCGAAEVVDMPPEDSVPPRTLMEKRKKVTRNADCCNRPRYR